MHHQPSDKYGDTRTNWASSTLNKGFTPKRMKEVPKETEAVLFVPCTHGGKLQKFIQEAEDKFTQGTNLKRIRVVEQRGFKLQDLLCTSNP